MTARAVVRDLLIVTCAISAGIHAALTPEHLREGAGPGGGFLASALHLLRRHGASAPLGALARKGALT